MHHEPGTTVAGRYRLDRLLVDVTSVTLWRGHDAVLDRPVAVRIVAGTHPRAGDVLEAARSTSRVDDRRVARVLDADEVAQDRTDGIYVVTAWAPGTDLAAALDEGPLDVDQALSLVADVADAVAVAHEQGVAHLALDPTNVVLGAGEDVTLLGLAVDAVLWGADDTDAPPVADARGLGSLLYACLTARWPGATDETYGLAPAPRIGGRLCTPGQVRAAVPASVDVLCRRALGEDLGEGALDTPAAVGEALAALVDDRGQDRWRPSSWFGRGARTAQGRR